MKIPRKGSPSRSLNNSNVQEVLGRVLRTCLVVCLKGKRFSERNLRIAIQGVPLQRSKWENQENDMFGVKKCLFGGPSWNPLNGLFGALNSHPQQGFSIEGGH